MLIFNQIEEFSKKLSIKGPIIAIDYGAKKIGLAISSPDRGMSLPLALLENNQNIFEEISKFISSKKVIAIVIGLPINMDGSEANNSKKIFEFSEKLYNHSNLPIFLQDERRTSKAADSLLMIAGYNRKVRNAIDDSIAATLILETALNRLKSIVT